MKENERNEPSTLGATIGAVGSGTLIALAVKILGSDDPSTLSMILQMTSTATVVGTSTLIGHEYKKATDNVKTLFNEYIKKPAEEISRDVKELFSNAIIHMSSMTKANDDNIEPQR